MAWLKRQGAPQEKVRGQCEGRVKRGGPRLCLEGVRTGMTTRVDVQLGLLMAMVYRAQRLSSSSGATSCASATRLKMQTRGLRHPTPQVSLRTLEIAAAGRPLDVTVAAVPIAPGDVALSIPDELVVTVDRIVQSETLGEPSGAARLDKCLHQ
jgi:hypothetical protein